MRSRKDNLKLCQERNRKEREGTGRIRIGRDNESAENAELQNLVSPLKHQLGNAHLINICQSKTLGEM